MRRKCVRIVDQLPHNDQLIPPNRILGGLVGDVSTNNIKSPLCQHFHFLFRRRNALGTCNLQTKRRHPHSLEVRDRIFVPCRGYDMQAYRSTTQ
jgi:hypothetical protein